MTRTRPERAAVREDLLSAARDVFAELGYHGASIDLIARRAGFSKGAVYSNFESKVDLFLELLTREVTEMTEALARGAVASGDPDADARFLASGLLALARDGRAQLVFAEFRAAAARDDVLARRLSEVRDLLVAAAAERLETELGVHGLSLSVDARDAATLLLTLTNGLALEQVGHVGPVVSVDSLTTVVRSLVHDTTRSTHVR